MATLEQKQAITALYVGYFGRAPDPNGLQFWIDQIDNGREFNTIAADFAASPEAEALYPYLTTPDVSSPELFVKNIYANLFDRTPDDEGLEFWVDALESGSVSVGDMIAAIIDGARDDEETGTSDKSVLDNKVEAGLDFATKTANTPGFEFDAAAKAAAAAAVNGVTEDDATVEAAKAATDAFVSGESNPGTGDNFTLTSAIGEKVVGTAGNDTFTGVVGDGTTGTLQFGDQVDGGAGEDTLNLFVTNASESTSDEQPPIQGPDSSEQSVAEASIANTAIPAGVSISNIEIINLNSGAGSLMGQVDARQFGAAAQQIWQVNTSNSVANLAAGQIAGFRGGVVEATVSYDDDASTASIALDGVNSGASLNISGDGLDTVSVSGSVAPESSTLAGDLTLTFTGEEVDDITTLNLALTSDTHLQTTASYASIVTVDASASTGGIEAALSGGDAFETIIGGSGDDELTLGGTFSADAVTIDAGAGEDVIKLEASDTDTAINITLGAGADRIVVNSAANVASDSADDDDLEASLITIADFNANDDVLDLSDFMGGYDELANDEATAVTNATSLTKAVAEAAKYVEAGDFTVFDYAGDAYVYAEGDESNDGLIMLDDVAVADLDSSAFLVGVAESNQDDNIAV
ncbi:DUF4214 domain-containing protein [Sulfitobacter sp. TB366]|uniref:DUF4214 domain-containing protein n=1 Tax=Sulfitobacter sp. TB366 TaxID=3368580 RepID=UPI003744B493